MYVILFFRCSQVDYLSFFIETIMDDFMEHLKCYKAATLKMHASEGETQLMSNSKLKLIEEAFFEAEDKDDPWRAVCCDQQDRLGQYVWRGVWYGRSVCMERVVV